jgi:hypothetical protein
MSYLPGVYGQYGGYATAPVAYPSFSFYHRLEPAQQSYPSCETDLRDSYLRLARDYQILQSQVEEACRQRDDFLRQAQDLFRSNETQKQLSKALERRVEADGEIITQVKKELAKTKLELERQVAKNRLSRVQTANLRMLARAALGDPDITEDDEESKKAPSVKRKRGSQGSVEGLSEAC